MKRRFVGLLVLFVAMVTLVVASLVVCRIGMPTERDGAVRVHEPIIVGGGE